MTVDIAPSILAADVMHMQEDIERIARHGIKTLHVDIMDGHFVPNISYGPSVVKALRGAFPDMTLDVHLMLSRPQDYFESFIKAGSDEITFHVEIEPRADESLLDMLKLLRQRGVKAGLSIKPNTASERIRDFIPYLDQILVMTVEPGFGGQKFMADKAQKLREIREMGFKNILSVDGGVGLDNAKMLVQLGANRLVIGTALFKAENPRALIQEVNS